MISSRVRGMVLTGIFFALFVALPACSGGSGPLTLRIDAPATLKQTDAPIDVNVVVANPGKGDKRPAAFEMMLKFDPAVIQVDDVDSGGYFSRIARSPFCLEKNIDNKAGTIRFVCGSTARTGQAPGVSSSAIVTAKVHAVGAGSAGLAFADGAQLADVNGEPLEFQQQQASLTVRP